MLSAVGLNKRWDEAIGLDGVSLDVGPGEVVCVIGPSGGGKSTLLRALCILEQLDSGRVAIDGEIYGFPTDEPWQRRPWPTVTMVFQQLFLWPHLSLRQNIVLPFGEHDRRAKLADLEELSDQLKMAEFLDRYPNEASLGQRQRAALARAVLLRPAYLLLDEITAALDVEQVAAVTQIVERLAEGGTGIVITTHALGFARKVASRVAFLEAGRIECTGDVGLLDSPEHPRMRAFLAMLA